MKDLRRDDDIIYLNAELHSNSYEERTQPNKLLVIQDPINSPFKGSKDRRKFIQKLRSIETQYSPPLSTDSD